MLSLLAAGRTWFHRQCARLLALPLMQRVLGAAPVRAAGRAGAAVLAWGPVAALRTHPIRTVLVTSTVAVLLAAGWARSCGLRGCPSAEELRAFRPSEGGLVLDHEGRTLGLLRPIRRVNVPLARVPRAVQLAFIAVEDRRFYAHHGIDWRGAGRAVLQNLRHAELREGSSTITMQAARSALLAHYEGERSLRRKLIELHLAGRLEAALTKAQILELYLNSIYLGDGTYGVEAASRHWFGKPAARLSLAEAALLAGLPRSPASYDPRRNPQRARERRDFVLGLMAEQQLISEDAARRARRVPLRVARRGWRPEGGPPEAMALVRRQVDSLLGDDPWRRGDLVIETTFDRGAQLAAERAIRDRAAAIARGRGERPGAVQGALVALDPFSGDLRAVVGSAVPAPGGFNRALDARRQPGSAFKPFVYAAALEAGYAPGSLVEDAPVTVANAGHRWSPANFGDEYHGTVTLADALAYSLNTATVRVSERVGVPNVVALARRAGIGSPLRAVPSLALGSEVVTPLELVRAYAPFANGGWQVTPGFLQRIRTTDGTALWERAVVAPVRALGEADAWRMTTMLQGVVEWGTAHGLRELGVVVPVAGKTGTSNDATDAWFVGYTRTLVAGVWFGYDTPRSLGPAATGGRLAVPAWASFYQRGWQREADSDGWSMPDGVEDGVAVPCVPGEDGDCGGIATPPEWTDEFPPLSPESPDAPEAPRPPAGRAPIAGVPVPGASPEPAALTDALERLVTERLRGRPELERAVRAEIRRALREAAREVRAAGGDY